jgi:hypothetical protein
MPRPKGLPKTGGRVRGTPNKTTQSVTEKLHELGCDPIEGLAAIAMNTNTAPKLKFRCYSELAQYAYPKRKAVDVSVPRGLRFGPGGLLCCVARNEVVGFDFASGECLGDIARLPQLNGQALVFFP